MSKKPRGPADAGGEGADPVDGRRDLPTVTMAGDTIDAYQVNYAVMSLVMGVGALDDGTTALIPFADIKLAGPESDEGEGPEVVFSELLTLENAAFLTAALLRDYGAICGHLAGLGAGTMRPEPARVTLARRYMYEVREQVQICIDRLDTVVGSLT